MDVLNLTKELLNPSSPHSLVHSLSTQLPTTSSLPSLAALNSSAAYSKSLPSPLSSLNSSPNFSTPLASTCSTPRSHGTPKTGNSLLNTSLPDTVNPASRVSIL